MNSEFASSPEDIASDAGVPERVATGVWNALCQLGRRVGKTRAVVVINRNPSLSFNGVDESTDDRPVYDYSAIGGRLVYNYNPTSGRESANSTDGEESGANNYGNSSDASVGVVDDAESDGGVDSPVAGIGIEDQHLILRRVEETQDVTDDLSAEGDIVLSPHPHGTVIGRQSDSFVFCLDSDYQLTPKTKVVLSLDGFELTSEYEGMGFDLPDELSGRMHKELFSCLERYTIYLNEGDTVFERLAEEGDDSPITIDKDVMDGVSFGDARYVKSTIIELHGNGFRTKWGTYRGDDAVQAIVKGVVLPPLAVNQEATPDQRTHNTGSLHDGRTRPPQEARPDVVYGDAE